MSVTDDGRGHRRPAGRPGYGIVGMRERAHACGGPLRTGPACDGPASRSTATLPLSAPAVALMLRVVLADDQDLFRAGFATILGAEPDIEVVAEAPDGAAAVRAALDHRPDVVLMDMRMPVLDGVAATRQVCALTASRVLALTMFDTDDYLYAALRAGASGFLLKDAPRADLVNAVRVVAAGTRCSLPPSPPG